MRVMKSVREFIEEEKKKKSMLCLFVNSYYILYLTYICATLSHRSTNRSKIGACYSDTAIKVANWCEVCFWEAKPNPR